MSDETKPVPLRLRPRAPGEAAPIAPAPPPAQPAASTSTPAAKPAGEGLKLKLNASAAASPAPLAPAKPVAAPPPPVAPPPKASTFSPAPTPPAPLTPPAPPNPEPATLNYQLPAAAEAAADKPAIRPIAVVLEDSAPSPATGATPLPSFSLPAKETSLPLRTPFVAPAPARSDSKLKGLIVALIVVLLATVGYYGYQKFVAAPPAPALVLVERPTPPPHPAASAAPQKSVPSTAAAALPAPATPAPAQVAASPAAPKPAAATPPAPSPAFLAWVNTVKISGVSNGTPPRALINGLLVSPGDSVDDGRGIIFDHLDPATQQVFFRDSAGALAGKFY